jgi:hypothetical protein
MLWPVRQPYGRREGERERYNYVIGRVSNASCYFSNDNEQDAVVIAPLFSQHFW